MVVVGDIGKGEFIIGQLFYDLLVHQIAVAHFFELATTGPEFAVFAHARHMARGAIHNFGRLLGRVPRPNRAKSDWHEGSKSMFSGYNNPCATRRTKKLS